MKKISNRARFTSVFQSTHPRGVRQQSLSQYPRPQEARDGSISPKGKINVKQ
jgi:hypothetical protein